MKFKVLAGFIVALFWPAIIAASPIFTSSGIAKIANGIPFAVENDTAALRVYYTFNSFQILSATSTNGGATWSSTDTVRIGTNTVPSLNVGSFTFTGAALLPLNSGGYRMIYSIATSTFGWRIVSATSTDGLAWANEARPILISTTAFIGSPQLIKRVNGDWRLYFLQDTNGGNNLADRQVFTSLSSDQGFTWSAPTVALAQFASGIAAVTRSDQLVRLYLTHPLTQESTSSVVISALQTDALGAAFGLESGVLLSTSSSIGALDSLTVFRSSGNIQWNMLYSYRNFVSTSTNIFDAITLNPDPQRMSPTQVVRTDPAQPFKVAGEVFDSTPTAVLSRSGETDIPGTGLVRNSDMSLTATFDTSNKTLGWWTLVVTNSDGNKGTLINAVLVTFKSGNVTLIDNLLRPNKGRDTQINIEIFDEGDVQVGVYTLDGHLVNSLYHASTPIGNLQLTWNGKTGDGNVVASGVYFFKITGPKLDTKQKVVVIR